MVELVHKFDPMKTKCVEEGAQCFHHEQYECGCECENGESDETNYDAVVPVELQQEDVAESKPMIEIY